MGARRRELVGERTLDYSAVRSSTKHTTFAVLTSRPLSVRRDENQHRGTEATEGRGRQRRDSEPEAHTGDTIPPDIQPYQAWGWSQRGRGMDIRVAPWQCGCPFVGSPAYMPGAHPWLLGAADTPDGI